MRSKHLKVALLGISSATMVLLLMGAGTLPSSRVDSIKANVQKAITDNKETMNGEGKRANLPTQYRFPANSAGATAAQAATGVRFLPIGKMQGYAPASGTQHRLAEKLMTYRIFSDKYTDGDVDFSISPDRAVWVWITEYPDGVDLGDKIGHIAKAQSIIVADAETGLYLGSEIRDLTKVQARQVN